ncbi:gamma-glutamyl-gamma-aminobutyrate hydrolase family protein [Ramlibacter humi]|uniref:Gamma-glutamyl-gamma-aminobutyrate hydrolase family protein n=1 Tax=Ramlibacter humi TaxID=2530451 RepID=A0A4Z0BKH0_9BURK|nr:type 1 glutamine amidotransferase [Ramlibacter humi]TFY98919.1 gamma-glutamyl-gamma-aminobutyrate hydrolase family protein [Ramlibacter humi]
MSSGSAPTPTLPQGGRVKSGSKADRLKIGISACFFHPDASRKAAPKKTLQWIEQSTAHWVMAAGALPVMIPVPAGDTFRGDVTVADYADWLDGLVLHGGADVWPGSYGEQPLRPEWNGDKARDDYEIALVKAFEAARKPVFGICRGLQLINVAHGGTLYQDISTQKPGARVHRDADAYDLNFHQVDILPGTRLSQLLRTEQHKINSVHHQGIKDLAPDFAVEATSPDDGVIEAIRHTGDAWVAAVQWHPEFHFPHLGVVDDTPLLHDFLSAAQAARTE